MKAIVYTSATGHTERYAGILGEIMGLPVCTLAEAEKQVSPGEEILYLGWLFANTIKGYKKAAGKYRVSAVCAVGLCDTGTAVPAVRKANDIPDAVPLFTMQGGMDKTKLRGVNRFMIRMLIRMMDKKKDKTEDDKRMIYLLNNDRDYVCKENTKAFAEWYSHRFG